MNENQLLWVDWGCFKFPLVWLIFTGCLLTFTSEMLLKYIFIVYVLYSWS